MRTIAVIALLVVVTAACVQKRKRLSKAEQDIAAQIVSRTPPKPSHPLDIRFENKVRLLGYDVGAAEMREGQTFSVTWYWQVDAPLGDGWKIFTHLADAERKSRMNLDAVRAMRELYPESEWKKGDYIKDVQEITLPADWHSRSATFFLGFWNGPTRLRVTVGPNDGDNRAEALTVPVAGAKPPPELARLIARRATGPIAIDGKLDEKDWIQTQSTGAFVQTMTGAAGEFAASARVLYDDKRLYVGYQVLDDYLKSSFTKADEHLWEQDAVELMVDPDGDGKNYFEIQVAPNGVVFDTRYDSRRLPQPFGEIGWSSMAEARVTLHGKLNDDKADQGYEVELAVPWTAFAKGPIPATPPAAGATWRMNFFVMDDRPGGPRAVGWSAPLVADFHTLERFGRVVFPQAAVAVAAPAAPAAGPPAARPTH